MSQAISLSPLFIFSHPPRPWHILPLWKTIGLFRSLVWWSKRFIFLYRRSRNKNTSRKIAEGVGTRLMKLGSWRRQGDGELGVQNGETKMIGETAERSGSWSPWDIWWAHVLKRQRTAIGQNKRQEDGCWRQAAADRKSWGFFPPKIFGRW